MRYVYGVTAAPLIGGAATTPTLNPVGAQTAQNDPAMIGTAPRAGAPMSFAGLSSGCSRRSSISRPARACR